MIGLTGAIGTPSATAALPRMLRASTPAARAITEEHHCALGSLAITHRPYPGLMRSAATPDGTVLLIFDGWILAAASESSPVFLSAHDLLTQYQKHGTAPFTTLNGAFNIVVVDATLGTVSLINDRHGLLPLEYADFEGALYFAPEGKVVLGGTNSAPKLDALAAFNLLSIGRSLLGGRTLFEGVRHLPPASIAKWSRGTFTVTRYWQFQYAPEPLRDGFEDELAATFDTATSSRIPPGWCPSVLLSGGLDSRMVCASLARAQISHRPLAVTFGLPDSDEVRIAQKTAARLGVEWHFIPLGPEDFITGVERGIEISEGQDLFMQSYGLKVFSSIESLSAIGFTGLAMDLHLGGTYASAELLEDDASSDTAREYAYKKLSYFDDSLLVNLWGSRDAPRLAREILQQVWEGHLMHTNWVDHVDQFMLRTRVNRTIVKRQLWQRLYMEDAMPTFDNHFMSLLCRVPARDRIGHSFYRRLLRKAYPSVCDIPYQRTLLPVDAPSAFWPISAGIENRRETLYREIWHATQGRVFVPFLRYATNYDEWMRTNPAWITFMNSLLLTPDSRLGDVGLDMNFVAKLVSQHRTGEADHRQRLLQLMTVELSLRQFFDREACRGAAADLPLHRTGLEATARKK